MTIHNEDQTFNRSFVFKNEPPTVTISAEIYDDYFKVLNIDRTDEIKVLEKAYRTLIRRFHPDHNNNPNAADRFQDLSKAYATLRDKLLWRFDLIDEIETKRKWKGISMYPDHPAKLELALVPYNVNSTIGTFSTTISTIVTIDSTATINSSARSTTSETYNLK